MLLRVGERKAFVHLHPIGRDRDPGIRVQYSLHALPHFVGGFLARVGFYRGRLRHGDARRRNLVGDGHCALDALPRGRGLAMGPPKLTRSLYEFAPSTENGYTPL